MNHKMKTHTKIKNDIYEYIINHVGTTFAGLTNNVDGFRGEYSWVLYNPKYKPIYLWNGISNKAIIAIKELISEDKILTKATQAYIYLIDGISLRLPTRPSKKHDSWCPLAFYKYSKTNKTNIEFNNMIKERFKDKIE